MPASTSLHRGLVFLHRFLRNPREVGALFPSTRHLGVQMVAGLQLQRGDLVLEYGPGTGALTDVIREHLPAGVHYLGIEREASFCAILARRMGDLAFEHGRVEDVEAILRRRGLPPPAAILSGLPLILLPTMHEIVTTAARIVRPGGTFRTFSYIQSYPTPAARRLRRLMSVTFAQFSISPLVTRTFPPAMVLCGVKAGGRQTPAETSPAPWQLKPSAHRGAPRPSDATT
jgi:phosphatidylethanolamine/phosphatidyl-N-methylethanolamine N-methyltransferase